MTSWECGNRPRRHCERQRSNPCRGKKEWIASSAFGELRRDRSLLILMLLKHSQAPWFETALARLLTMRIELQPELPDLILRSGVFAASRRMKPQKSNRRHNPTFPRRVAPELCIVFRPSEGVGNAGCPMHPQPRVQSEKAHERNHHEFTRIHPAFPHAMVLTVSFEFSPVIGLSCHRRPMDIATSAPGWADIASAGLDAGVEASGPHDFAVRESIPRPRASRSLTGDPPCNPIARKMLPRPPHPASRP
jgi:hypothetical protein